MDHDDSPDALDLKYRTIAAVRNDPNMPEPLRTVALEFLDGCRPATVELATEEIKRSNVANATQKVDRLDEGTIRGVLTLIISAVEGQVVLPRDQVLSHVEAILRDWSLIDQGP